jgi:hypothetical protein
MKNLINAVEYKKPSVISLVAINLCLLVLAIFLQWSLFEILFIFWAETLVIGVFNIFKMLIIPRKPKMSSELKEGKASTEEQLLFLAKLGLTIFKFFAIVFSTFLFFGFCYIQLMMISILFGGGEMKSFEEFQFSDISLDDWTSFYIGVGSILFSHAVSFVSNYLGKKEYLNLRLRRQMFAPFRRILLVWIVSFGTMYVIHKFGNDSVYLLIPFFVVKIILDLRQHHLEHKKVN